MNNEADTLDELTKLAQSLLLQKAQVEGQQVDPTQVKVFKFVQQDIDGDGQEEICFIAGIKRNPEAILYAYEVVWLLDPLGDSYHVVELTVTSSKSFRELVVLDINNDHIPEVVFWFQEGSGAFLTFYVFQWNGNALTSIFPMQKPFSKGFVEMKDLDADGVDEVVIWEDIYEEGANWAPKRFSIHVFHFDGQVYKLETTHQTERHYSPASIVNQSISMLGMPVHYDLRLIPVEEYKQRLNLLASTQKINEDFVIELYKHQNILSNEAFYEESLAITDLALEATQYLLDPLKRSDWRIGLCKAKALTLYQMGNFPQAAQSYLEALSYWSDGSSFPFPVPEYEPAGLLRMLGAMYALTNDFEHALEALSAAQKLLNTKDLTSPEIQTEMARLYSNFALTYSWLGDAPLATMAFDKAIVLDQELGRTFALIIDYLGKGNVQRATDKYQDAIQSYQSALEALKQVSERDREADVDLELGITLIVLGQLEKGLHHLQQSLLLTSEAGLRQQGGKHYLYLGEAYRQMSDSQRAELFYKKAFQLAEELNVPETQWQALYGLAKTSQRTMRLQETEQYLSAAIEIIEQLRTQYLPEQLKLSLLASGKTKPYETIVLLFHSQSRFGSAFDYSERAKSRVFIEELAFTSLGGFERLPNNLVQQETALANQLRSLQLRDRAAVSQQRYEWGDDIAQVESRLEQVWDKLRTSGSQGAEYVELRKATPLNFTGVKLILNNL